MKIPLNSPVHLLHKASFATLATNASQLTGYPYSSALPCVFDETLCPLFCSGG